jgi:hypothetical protein
LLTLSCTPTGDAAAQTNDTATAIAQLEQNLNEATKANAELEKKMKSEQPLQEKAATGDSEVRRAFNSLIQIMLTSFFLFILRPIRLNSSDNLVYLRIALILTCTRLHFLSMIAPLLILQGELALKASNDKLRAQLKKLLDAEHRESEVGTALESELQQLRESADRSAQEASAARRELERTEAQVGYHVLERDCSSAEQLKGWMRMG